MKSCGSQFGKRKPSGLLFLSVCLNLVFASIAAKLFTKPVAPPTVATNSFVVVTVQTQSATAVVSAAETFVTNRFHWRQIESTNYEQYVAHLRVIGCPEKTLEDIIMADVDRHFAARHRAAHLELPFWTGGRQRRTAEQAWRGRLRALEQEQAALLQQLLGIEWFDDAGTLRMDRFDEQALARFLCGPMPDETFRRTAKIFNKYETLKRELNRRNSYVLTDADEVEMRNLATGLKRELQGLLAPAQWEEFSARLVAAQFFKDDVLSEATEMTPAEARQIARAWLHTGNAVDFFDFSNAETETERDLHQQQFTNAVAQLLGEKRFADFDRAQDRDFRELFDLAQENNLTKATAVKVYDIRRIAVEEVERVRNDTALDESARRRKFEEMQVQLQTAVSVALGTVAYQEYLKRNGSWITNLTHL